MPTPAQFITTLVTAIEAELTSELLTFARMDSDLTTQNQPVPAGEVRYQLQSFTLPQTTLPDSGAYYYPAVLVVFLIHFKIDRGETGWTQGSMQPLLQTFTTPQWWHDLDGVHYVDDDPVGSDVARVGNVVSFTVTATVTIDPP